MQSLFKNKNKIKIQSFGGVGHAESEGLDMVGVW